MSSAGITLTGQGAVISYDIRAMAEWRIQSHHEFAAHVPGTAFAVGERVWNEILIAVLGLLTDKVRLGAILHGRLAG